MLGAILDGRQALGQDHSTSTNQATSVNDSLINALIRKGVLTEKEAADIKSEVSTTPPADINSLPSPQLELPPTIKSMRLFGDLRVRYEYRSAVNPPYLSSLGEPPISPRERFRYALRFGVKGDAFDDFSYGFRLETASNPRSPWLTFGSDSTSGTPSSKTGAGVNVGQLYINWHPAKWFEMTVGKMPMALYTSTMVWDNDICPEGAFEKFNMDVGNVNLFLAMGQFDYENPTSSQVVQVPSGDVFLMAWQAGATVNFDTNLTAKAAPVLYTYSGSGVANPSSLNSAQSQLHGPYTGQPEPSVGNVLTYSTAYNEYGINNLMVLEIPAEFDFPIKNTPLGNLRGRLFGDIAFNLDGAERARAAAAATQSGLAPLSRAYTQETKAYQVGMGIGSEGLPYGTMHGLVYGNVSKKHAWEARVYWQHVEQYALDVNLLDSDFFEGRGNLQGLYGAFSYGFSDAVLGTLRYGSAHMINHALGTGGNNPDLPGLNPVDDYRIIQLDLTFRF